MPARCIALSRPWGKGCQLQRDLAESPSSRNLEMCKGIFKQSKVRVSRIRQKGKCSSAPANISVPRLYLYILYLHWNDYIENALAKR